MLKLVFIHISILNRYNFLTDVFMLDCSGNWGFGGILHAEKVVHGMLTTSSTANIKYLVKITRDGAKNANQLRMPGVLKR